MAEQYLGEIMRTKANATSTSSNIFSSKFRSRSKSKEAQAYDFKKMRYKQLYEKVLYLNYEMTHWVNYKLMEKEGNCLTTTSNSPCPLVALKIPT
jgi:hypothetical protein